MGGDDHAAPTTGPSTDGGSDSEPKGLHRLVKALFDRTPWGKRLNRHTESVRDLHQRMHAAEVRSDGAENALREIQHELESLRSQRLAGLDERLDVAERRLAEDSEETARLRDEVIPAAVGRSDVLLERLHAELEETGSLVERILLNEPLPVADDTRGDDVDLYQAIADVQPDLLASFRGSEAEIRHRLEHYLEPLRQRAPVLDLGCGRGELLLMLRDAGIEAMGIEGDPAVAQATRRRGLDVIEGDVLEALRGRPDDSCNAVTAIHLFEHLEPAVLAAVLAEARRVLSPDGLLVIECPNPHSLRVGAALFWIDPTHRRPLMPETLELFLTGGGFRVEKTELLHPFPEKQLFSGSVADDDLARRLDELINGPRDFAIWASKPT